MKIHMNLQLFAQPANHTGATGMSAEMKTYYEKRLLDQAEPLLVHDQFGDKYPIPANNGKTIEFRKYDSLPKADTPLPEGCVFCERCKYAVPECSKDHPGMVTVDGTHQVRCIRYR